MEVPEQVSELPAHYMTPTAGTPDRQRYTASLRPCCCNASITAVTIDVTCGDGWVWGLLTFPLLNLQPLRGVGVGLGIKGGMVGSGTKLSFGQVGEKEGGLNE
eukprot:scaffold234770_cov70-Attheya_sp.AAC.1